jgi:hypothetical protein
LNAIDLLPSIPGYTVLYKFRPLDTEQDVDRAADIFLNRRLFVASPSSFNDPFDCQTPYCFDATPQEKINRAVARILKEDPSIPEVEARRRAPGRCKAAETEGLKSFRSFIESEIGVVSLAGILENPLLWAHYASAHTGICIEFCISNVAHVGFFWDTLPVCYQEERPIVSFYRDELEAQLRKSLLTKSQDWAYEREWRIILKNRQAQPYYPFDASLVGAVYLGCRITHDKREMVKRWLSQGVYSKPPKLFQAKVSETRYALTFNPVL